MEQTGIQATTLTVTKKRKPILDNLDFTIASGSLTGLIGPSGSGKTTLMRTIVGVQTITRGSLTIFGEPAGSQELRSKIGYVTQNPAIYEDLTVKQNIDYFAILTRAPKGQVEEIIERVQLDGQRHQLAGSLSGGQKARVSLAVALLGDPRLLILDEPTVGLDPLLRQDLWALFDDLSRQGKTLLVSSHVMDEAERCHSLLLLRQGKLLWHGAKDQLLAQTTTGSVGEAFIAMIKRGEA